MLRRRGGAAGHVNAGDLDDQRPGQDVSVAVLELKQLALSADLAYVGHSVRDAAHTDHVTTADVVTGDSDGMHDLLRHVQFPIC
ncbi:hypothetical protein AB0E62_06490 [Streptomyces sp. NPDC038707]|uniref:hypothetical protein n=1 Tax=Streptomyces sp. NPDC038707 TaxID=3154329 RepID=UPI0033FE346F